MRFHLSVVAVIAAMLPIAAYAGAWTQDAGKGQIIINGLYYNTDRLYNNQGNKTSQTTYTKYELNPYLEYGWTDDITVGANLSLQRADQSSNTNWGFGDSEFFLRKRLWQQDGFVLSAEPMIKLPSPEGARETPQLGGSHPDAGLGLSAGYGFSAWGLNHFANLDAGYRYRFGQPENQIKLAGTLGIATAPRWMIMPQLFATYRANTPSTVTFTQSSGDDYNLVKLQLSTVYQLQDDLSLQAGGFSHAEGKNVGAGSGLFMAVWKKF